MGLQVECQECGARYNVGENLAGKRAKCKKCGATMQIPAPAVEETDDAMSAMMELAQGAGPAPDVSPRRGKAPAANKIPAHWSPDSVVVEAASAPPKKKLNYARRSGGVDPEALARLLVFLYIAAMIGFAIFAHVKFGGDAPARRLGAMWGIVISNIIFYFLIAGPVTLLGAWIGAKIFQEDLAGGAYARALGLAALPPFVLITLTSLAMAGVFPMDRTVPMLGLMLILPGTYLLVKVLFEFDWLKALVPWVLALIFCAIGSGTAGGLSKKVGDTIVGDDAPQFAFSSGRGSSQQSRQSTSNNATNTSSSTPTQSPAEIETKNKRVQSQQNLIQIHIHLLRYYQNHQKAYPPDLQTLTQTEGLSADHLRSPFGPAFASADYVYTPFVNGVYAGSEAVLAYDAAELATGDGAYVLFGDRVGWLPKDRVEAALERGKEVRLAAAQTREQELAQQADREKQRKDAMASNNQAAPGDGGATVNASPSDVPGRRTGPGVRGGRRQDLIDKIKTSEGGVVKDVQDVAMRRGTDGFIRTITPSPFYAVYVQDPAGETIEVYNGADPDPKATATFQADPQHRGNYALSPDGKLLVRLTSWPKLTAVVHSFEKKQDVAKIDLLEANGRPTLVGFATPERFIVRWTQGFKHGIEVFEALKTGKPKGIVMPEQFQPSAGNEAVSPDGRLFAVTARVPDRVAATRRPPRGGPMGQERLVLLVYELFGKPDPRRFPVAGLDPDFRVQAAGIAFSPDNQRVAALFENNRKGFITSWRLRDGKVVSEPVVPGEVEVPTGPNFNRQRVLDWVAGGRAWLVSGNVLLNADTGAGIGRLAADNKVRGQAVTTDFTVHLPHGDLSGIDGVLAVTLDPSKFPAPASASPTTPAATGTRPGTAPRTSGNAAPPQ
jgi:hypothetical protein